MTSLAFMLGFIVEPMSNVQAEPWPRWKTLTTQGQPHPRHEAGFVTCNEKMYLLGGRRIQPVDIFDPATRTWTQGAAPPIEIHHMQPVVWDHRIWCVGAMTGKYPHETAVERVLIYDPRSDQWSYDFEIPLDRRRGGAGAVIHNDSLYLVCGIQNGHWDGWVAWLDRFDLKSRTWHRLSDAPRVRDHFHAAVAGNRLYAIGGRKTSRSTKETFNLIIPEVDVYDFASETWTTLPATSNLPTPRAGCFAFGVGDEVLIAGGETQQPTAHNEIQAFNIATSTWRMMSVFSTGRHGTGIGYFSGSLYTSSGSGGRGGGPELTTTEMLSLGDDLIIDR
ncbi:MAG: kelch repeat-containing protein [Planctomycetota bacterium]